MILSEVHVVDGLMVMGLMMLLWFVSLVLWDSSIKEHVDSTSAFVPRFSKTNAGRE